MTEPTTLRAGDSATWSLDLPLYPASSGWSLHYRLLWRTGAPINIAAVPDAGGTLYTVTLTADATAAFAPGAATLVWWIKNEAGQQFTLGHQAVTILPNLISAGNFDARSASQIALADARAALAKYVSGGRLHVSEYSIAGRNMKFRSADEIQALISHYEREVARENSIAALLQGVASGRVCIRM